MNTTMSAVGVVTWVGETWAICPLKTSSTPPCPELCSTSLWQP